MSKDFFLKKKNNDFLRPDAAAAPRTRRHCIIVLHGISGRLIEIYEARIFSGL